MIYDLVVANCVPLVAEGRTADELAEERGRRNFLLRYRHEILQEFEQSMRFGILLAEFGYLGEDRFSMAFEYRELKDQCGVEHDVRFLLEGIYPFGLAPYDRRASRNSLLRRIAAVFVVAYDASEQPDVGCRNPVMIIDIDSGES